MVGPSGGHYPNHTIQKQLVNDERFEEEIKEDMLHPL